MARTTIKAVPQINVKAIDKALTKERDANTLICGYLAAEDGGPACDRVGRCAVGALLFYAGYPLDALLKNDGEGVHETNPASKAAKLLKNVYGLLPVHTGAITSVNDCSNTEERYENVMGLVSFAAVMQDNGVQFPSDGNLWASYTGDLEDDELSF